MSGRNKEKPPIEWGKAAIDLGVLVLSLWAINECNSMREVIQANHANYQYLISTHGKVFVDAMVGSGSDFGNTMLAVCGFDFLKRTFMREHGRLMDFFALSFAASFAFLELGEAGNPVIQKVCEQTGNECFSMLDALIYTLPAAWKFKETFFPDRGGVCN